jgi:phosphoglycolate phosphatase-like HAD superfamily hydrolase
MPSQAEPRPLPVRAVLFDLDGTLADTASDLAAALNRVRADRSLPPLTVAALRPHASDGSRGMLGAGLGVTQEHPEWEALKDAFLDYYAAGLSVHTRLFAGAEDALGAIEGRGLTWGIVTNKAARFTLPLLDHLGIAARAVVARGDPTGYRLGELRLRRRRGTRCRCGASRRHGRAGGELRLHRSGSGS